MNIQIIITFLLVIILRNSQNIKKKRIKKNTDYKSVISNVELGQSRKRRQDVPATRYH